MTTAIQWHAASNAKEPSAIGWSHTDENDVTKGVILVVSNVGDGANPSRELNRAAAALSRDITDIYRAIARKDDEVSTGVRSRESELLDLSSRLSYAVASGLKRTFRPLLMPSEMAAHPVETLPPQTPPKWAVLAIVVYGSRLIVARRGGGHLFLLRDDKLQNLIDSSFMEEGDCANASTQIIDAVAADTATFEPEIGQLDLHGEDRILICNDTLRRHLSESKIRTLLRASASSRRTSETLLYEAGLSGGDELISVAVVDCVTGPAREQPVRPQQATDTVVSASLTPTRESRRFNPVSIVAITTVILLVVTAALATIISTNSKIENRTGVAQTVGEATQMPSAPVGALNPSPTLTLTPLPPTPTPPPTVVAATAPAVNTPQAQATLVPVVIANTPIDTATAAPTALATPEPTNTPAPTQAPTSTPEPTATPAPTQTPKPTSVPTATAHPRQPKHQSQLLCQRRRPRQPKHQSQLLCRQRRPRQPKHQSQLLCQRRQPHQPKHQSQLLPTATAAPTQTPKPTSVPTATTARQQRHSAPTQTPTELPTDRNRNAFAGRDACSCLLVAWWPINRVGHPRHHHGYSTRRIGGSGGNGRGRMEHDIQRYGVEQTWFAHSHLQIQRGGYVHRDGDAQRYQQFNGDHC